MFHERMSATTAGPLSVAGSILTPIERQVVRLAIRDDRATVCRGGPIRRLSAGLFGTRRANALANPRLEALRRFCVGRRVGCNDAARAYVLAECDRCGLTKDVLWAAALLSDLAVNRSSGAS